MRQAAPLGIVAGLGLFAMSVSVRADTITPAHRDLVASVGKRIVTAVKTPPTDYTWPPIIEVTTEAGEDNACAFVDGTDTATGKPVSHMWVSPSLLDDILKNEPDALAFVMGHELGHVLKKHVTPVPDHEKTKFLHATFTRNQELEADQVGMELALGGGYSFRKALRGPRSFINAGLEGSNFEYAAFDHPSWKERIAALDKEQSALWHAMCGFDNGQYFLTIEQYGAAERCFQHVTDEFPKCYEAWANLGYARLMRYCDNLETADVRRFGIGQIVVGGFYRRPQSLEAAARGIDRAMWKGAETALKSALALKPDLTLAEANLGLAYLVAPDGKNVAKASQYLQSAAKRVRTDDAVDPYSRAAVLINAGITEIAGGKIADGQAAMAQGERYANSLAVGGASSLASGLSDALLYNRAILLADSGSAADKTAALPEMEKYLRSASSASAWWPLAYERYAALSKAQGKTPTEETALRSASQGRLRPLTSFEVGGNAITVSDPVSMTETKLGKGAVTPLVPNTNLRRLHYPQYGVDLLATNEVLGICLCGPSAPALKLRGAGLGAGFTTLTVGMTKQELDSALHEDFDFAPIADPSQNYRFYRNLGLAVLVRGGKVQEMMIVRLPRQG